LIDNGLYGVSATYELQPDWRIKVFGGKQKNLFETYESFIKGVVIDGYLSIGEENKVALVPGFGVINKTFSDDQIDELISTVRTYTPQDSLGLYYNSYAASIYNTLSFGPITWYVEGAVKTRDIYFDPDAERSLYTGENTLGRFRNDAGSVLYSSLGFGKKGFGASFEYKRTENFSFRADPFTALNRGIVNYLPPMSKINTYRLKSRYTPAPRELAEEAIQVEIRYTPVKKWRIVHYFSNITDLSGNQLYREIDNEINFRPSVANQITFGIQAQTYNQAIYEGKSGVPNVKTVTPYFEWFRKLSARKSMKIEAQFMSTKQDFGSWAFALIEYSIAPRWSFALSDMYNVDPIKTAALHYPRVDVVFVQKTNRFGLSYIKQVEGVVCAGGICRLEPAFSGIRFSLNSTF
ncbi:MAG: hypothetical protein HKN76_09215, partial [Saprospiraceae bacterium]|nr:hypothetical protein [Saprospiraceae bacterium]